MSPTSPVVKRACQSLPNTGRKGGNGRAFERLLQDCTLFWAVALHLACSVEASTDISVCASAQGPSNIEHVFPQHQRSVRRALCWAWARRQRQSGWVGGNRSPWLSAVASFPRADVFQEDSRLVSVCVCICTNGMVL